MKILKRNIAADITVTNTKNFPCCQASFNSDGNITLRNHDITNNNEDEIVILTKTETRALIDLICEMEKILKQYELPF